MPTASCCGRVQPTSVLDVPRNPSHTSRLSMPEEPRDRSVSGDFDDSDFESQHDANQPGKPGRKKNPNSQAARRDQNRIAQREFRLRKQQRIRDLEARVEILSGGKDEAIGEMRNMVKDLMAENQTLRNLLRSLASFIGEGVGGMLPKLGWDPSDFNTFLNKSETDTAWEGYQRRKKTQQSNESNAPANAVAQGQKRSAEDDSAGGRSKRPRNGDETDADRVQNGFSMLVAMNPTPLSTNHIYASNTRPQQDRSGMFQDLMRGTGNSPLFMQQSPTTMASPPYGGVQPPNLDGYSTSYIPGVNLNVGPSLTSMPFESQNPGQVSASQPPQQPQSNSISIDDIEDEDPNRNEAHKLIHYHLDNFKRNPSYCLPTSLRPSLVQRNIPHESVIDRILHPELRDRMILLRNRYDLADCLMDYNSALTIHGDDVLAHSNWEIGESFIRKYNFLIDKSTLATTSKWRRERGEIELTMSDIGGDASPTPA